MVEGQIILHQGGHNRHLVLGIVVHDLPSRHSPVCIIGIIQTKLLLKKSIHTGFQSSLRDSIIVRSERAVKLKVVAVNIVIWVIHDRVVDVVSRPARRRATS